MAEQLASRRDQDEAHQAMDTDTDRPAGSCLSRSLWLQQSVFCAASQELVLSSSGVNINLLHSGRPASRGWLLSFEQLVQVAQLLPASCRSFCRCQIHEPNGFLPNPHPLAAAGLCQCHALLWVQQLLACRLALWVIQGCGFLLAGQGLEFTEASEFARSIQLREPDDAAARPADSAGHMGVDNAAAAAAASAAAPTTEPAAPAPPPPKRNIRSK